LVEVELNVLSDVELVVVVILHRVLQEPVHELGDACQGMPLGQVVYVVRTFSQRVVKHVDKEIKEATLSQVLLPSSARDAFACEGICRLCVGNEVDELCQEFFNLHEER
jgi:hypothetical protein